MQQRPGSQNSKKLQLFKENESSQVKEFSTFLCIKRCKSLISFETGDLGPVSCAFSSRDSSGALLGVAAVVAARWAWHWQPFVSILNALRAHHSGSCDVWFGGCNTLCLLIGKRYFSSQWFRILHIFHPPPKIPKCCGRERTVDHG